MSAIDHERMRGAGEVSTNYNLTASSPLPNRDAILKNKHNKWELSRGLSSFNLGPDVTMDSRNDGAITHDNAAKAAEFGNDISIILSDDTDVFVMLVYWNCTVACR